MCRKEFRGRAGWLLALGLALAGAAPGDADDAAVAPSAEPLVVLRLASLDRVFDDVRTLLRAGGVPQYATILDSFLTGFDDLRGLDRSRPVGAMLFADPDAPDRDPLPLICLPVTEIDDLRNTLALTGNLLEPAEPPGVYRLTLGKDTLRGTAVGGYLCLTDLRRPSPALTAEGLARLLDETASQADAVLHLRRAGLPESLLSRFLEQMAADAERDLARRSGETEAQHALRAEFAQLVLPLVRTGLLDLDRLSAELDLPAAPAPLRLRVAVAFRRDSPLPGALAKLPLASTGPASVLASGDAPLVWRHGVLLSEDWRQFLEHVVAQVRRETARGFDPQAPEDVRRPIGRLLDALAATARSGRMEGSAAFLPTASDKLVLAGAIGLEDAAAVDAALRVLLPFVARSPEIAEATADAFVIGELRFHRIRGRRPRARDLQLYGPDLALHLAASPGAVWFALGGAGTEAALRSRLAPTTPRDETSPNESRRDASPPDDRSANDSGADPEAPTPEAWKPDASAPDVPARRSDPEAVAKVKLRMLPWLRLAAAAAPDGDRNNPRRDPQDGLVRALAFLSTPESPGDAARAELRPTPDGLAVVVVLDRGYVELLAHFVGERLRQR